jgi:uncharacterized damage-inducible protein DinB
MAEEQTTGIAGDGNPRTVAELHNRIAVSRGALEQATASMSDEEFAAASDGWSAKDHLAHVAAWERRLLGEIQGDDEAASFGLDVNDAADTDTLNAMLYARHRDDSPATVRAEFRAAAEAVRAAFAELSDTDLMRPVRPDDPAVDTLVDLIAWDTFKHYPDHTAAITSRT